MVKLSVVVVVVVVVLVGVRDVGSGPRVVLAPELVVVVVVSLVVVVLSSPGGAGLQDPRVVRAARRRPGARIGRGCHARGDRTRAIGYTGS